MKKRILGVAFGAAVLFSTGTTAITTITEAEASPTLGCGTGHDRICCQYDNITRYGGGKPIILKLQ